MCLVLITNYIKTIRNMCSNIVVTFSYCWKQVSFVQIVGVTSEELQAAQHWNGLGVVNLLRSARGCGPWLVTDMRRMHSAMEDDPSIAEKIQCGIERDGSNTSGVSAKCW